MTRIVLTLLIILSFSLLANAQFSKGTLLVGGELSYTGNSGTNSGSNLTNHSGNYNLSLGKAIGENTVFGINLTYSHYSTNNYYGSPITNKGNNYSIGIFYRKYQTLGKEFFLFGEIGAAYTNSTESSVDSLGFSQYSGSGNGGQIYFMPGIAYKVSKIFFIEITIPNIFLVQFSNSHTNFPNTSPENMKSFSISTSLNSNPLSALGIGFRLNL